MRMESYEKGREKRFIDFKTPCFKPPPPSSGISMTSVSVQVNLGNPAAPHPQSVYPSPAKRPMLVVPTPKIPPTAATDGSNRCRVCSIAYEEPRTEMDLALGPWIGCQFNNRCTYWAHASCKGFLVSDEEAGEIPFYCVVHMPTMLKRLNAVKEKEAVSKGKGKGKGRSSKK